MNDKERAAIADRIKSALESCMRAAQEGCAHEVDIKDEIACIFQDIEVRTGGISV
jgi:hypothetical protein